MYRVHASLHVEYAHLSTVLLPLSDASADWHVGAMAWLTGTSHVGGMIRRRMTAQESESVQTVSLTYIHTCSSIPTFILRIWACTVYLFPSLLSRPPSLPLSLPFALCLSLSLSFPSFLSRCLFLADRATPIFFRMSGSGSSMKSWRVCGHEIV